jgi:hypothetical protein
MTGRSRVFNNAIKNTVLKELPNKPKKKKGCSTLM